jgi:hypothetical protein
MLAATEFAQQSVQQVYCEEVDNVRRGCDREKRNSEVGDAYVPAFQPCGACLSGHHSLVEDERPEKGRFARLLAQCAV